MRRAELDMKEMGQSWARGTLKQQVQRLEVRQSEAELCGCRVWGEDGWAGREGGAHIPKAGWASPGI